MTSLTGLGTTKQKNHAEKTKKFPYFASTKMSNVMGLFYSLLFGGSLPHFFYEIMEQILTSQRGLKQMLFFTTERLLYTPMFQAVSLYSLAILEVWRQSSTTKHPPHRSFLWINKNFLFLSLLFFRCGFGRAKVTPPPWPICTRCTGPY